MKFIFFLLFVLALIFGTLIGCGSSAPPQTLPQIVNIPGVVEFRDPSYAVCHGQRITLNIIQYELDKGQEAGAEAIDALRTAVDAWNGFSGEDLFVIAAVYENYVPGQNIDRNIGIGVTSDILPLSITAADKNCGCGIEIGYQVAPFWRAYAHELGHCLGYRHSNDENSLMFSDYQNGNFDTQILEELP